MKKQILLPLLKSEVVYISLSLLIIGCNNASSTQNQLQTNPQIENKLFNSSYRINSVTGLASDTLSKYQSFTVNDATEQFTSITWNYYSSLYCNGEVFSSVTYESSTPTFSLNAGTWAVNDTTNYNNCQKVGSCEDEVNNTYSIQVTYRYGGGTYTGQCYNNGPKRYDHLNQDKLGDWTSGSKVHACKSGSPCSFGGSYLPDNLPIMKHYVYVTNSDSNNISMYVINENTGELKAIGSGIKDAESVPNGIAVVPYGKYVYAVNNGNNIVSMYSINESTGELDSISSHVISTGNAPLGIAIDPSGKYVYVTNNDDSNISMYNIHQKTGELIEIGAISTSEKPYGIKVDPTGNYVYVANYNSNNISIYSINRYDSGKLTEIGTINTGSGPIGIAIDPSGKYLYTGNYFSNNISMYGVDNKGLLTSNFEIPSTGYTFDIAADPTGKYVYVTNSINDTIAMYRLDKTAGTLRPINGGTINTGSAPLGIAIDPSGRYVYVANSASDNISMYRIAESGQLVEIGTAYTEDGKSPFNIAIASFSSK